MADAVDGAELAASPDGADANGAVGGEVGGVPPRFAPLWGAGSVGAPESPDGPAAAPIPVSVDGGFVEGEGPSVGGPDEGAPELS
jgi:hypothetical protein